MLRISNLQAGYGQSQVLQGVSLTVRPGEIVCLLGRNGSGRSTLAKALMGLLPWRGEVSWNGHTLQGLRPFQIARLGVGYVPEDRAIFSELTVHQNLLLGEKRASAQAFPWDHEQSYRMFPALRARQHTAAGLLSGGEQQMLALCRSLMGQPGLLVVDEPTEGLAPQMVEQMGALLRLQRERGVAVLLIEQKLKLALVIADRLLVMGQGRVVFDGSAAGLMVDNAVRQQWLEV